MNNPKISIIVPVYKAEKYIRKCLDSIIAQTFSDWECILVDDGSPDASGAICDEYAAADSRFRVIHKENGGVSSARQKGLDTAVGEYIIHVDSDDWIENEMLSELYSTAQDNDADIVICDFFLDTLNSSEYACQKPKSLQSVDIMRQLILQQLHGSCWNKLVSRECCLLHNAHFPENLVYWEDQFFWYQVLPHNVKVVYLPKAFYHYDRISNNNSLSSDISSKKFESMKWITDYLDNNPLYTGHDLFYLKKEIKICAFLYGKDKKTITDLYKEQNLRFLEEVPFSINTPSQNAVRFILKGYNFSFVKFYYWLYINASKIKNQIIKSIWNKE